MAEVAVGDLISAGPTGEAVAMVRSINVARGLVLVYGEDHRHGDCEIPRAEVHREVFLNLVRSGQVQEIR